MNKNYIYPLFISMLLFSLLSTSCKEDLVKGCTNPDASNYSSAAEIDNNTCEFDRDKFLGGWIGRKDCVSNPLDTNISIEILPEADNVRRIIINDFPDPGLSATAVVNSSKPREFTIDNQEIVNDLDVYTLSGKAETFENTMVINYYKRYDISNIDTCGLGINKQE